MSHTLCGESAKRLTMSKIVKQITIRIRIKEFIAIFSSVFLQQKTGTFATFPLCYKLQLLTSLALNESSMILRNMHCCFI